MTKRLRLAGVVLFAVWAGASVPAQIATYPTPPPVVTAENQDWYLSGAPIAFGGIIYYPSGPVRHFNRNEMLPVGHFGDVPVYITTTREPRSMIFIPLAGGLVRPYEQRRAGDLAGTAGSVPPAYPVTRPAEERDRIAAGPLRAAAPPTGAPVSALGIAQPVVEPADGRHEPAPEATRGLAPVHPAPAVPRHVQIGPAPRGLNSIWVDYGGRRWVAAGPAVERPADVRQVGEYEGFPVYAAEGRPDVLYVPVVSSAPGLVTPYQAR